MEYTIDNCPVKPGDVLIYTGTEGYGGRRALVEDVWYSSGTMRLRIEVQRSVGQPEPTWSRHPAYRLSLAYVENGTLTHYLPGVTVESASRHPAYPALSTSGKQAVDMWIDDRIAWADVTPDAREFIGTFIADRRRGKSALAANPASAALIVDFEDQPAPPATGRLFRRG